MHVSFYSYSHYAEIWEIKFNNSNKGEFSSIFYVANIDENRNFFSFKNTDLSFTLAYVRELQAHLTP